MAPATYRFAGGKLTRTDHLKLDTPKPAKKLTSVEQRLASIYYRNAP